MNDFRHAFHYHIEIERHYYSVPFDLVHEQVEARIRSATVEIFHKNRRVAIYARSSAVGGFSTLAEHHPPKHRHYLEWTPERLIDWSNLSPEPPEPGKSGVPHAEVT